MSNEQDYNNNNNSHYFHHGSAIINSNNEDDLTDSVRSNNPLLVGVGYENDTIEHNSNSNRNSSYYTQYHNLNHNYQHNNETGGYEEEEFEEQELNMQDLENDNNNIYNNTHNDYNNNYNNNNNNLTESSQIFTSVPLNSLPSSPFHVDKTQKPPKKKEDSYENEQSNNKNINSYNNYSNNHNNNNHNNKNKINSNEEDNENSFVNKVKNNIFIHEQHQSQVPDQYLEILKASHSAVQRKKRNAIALRVGREWLTYIITVQTIGNLIRALPIFVLEKYYVMLLIFFQALFLVIGSYGVKKLKPYLILLYVIGCFGTTILDLIMTFTYAHTQSSRPFTEAQLAFWSYVLFVSLLCILNIIGGLLLGLKLFVSVVTIQDSNNSLVLFTASFVGGFDTRDEEDKVVSNKSNRCIFFYGSDVKKALATTSSISKSLSPFETFKMSIKSFYQKSKESFSPSSTAVVATKDSSQNFVMKSNQVITSKYNVVTFIPKVIIYQFSRLANLYTLAIVILCMFSFSPVGPVSSFTPLLVVIATTASKEFLEDLKRHKQDREINGREACIYRPPYYSPDINEQSNGHSSFSNKLDFLGILEFFGLVKKNGSSNESSASFINKSDVGIFQKSCWQDIKVGDIVYVKNGELLPADIICLSTSRPDGRSYLETANLDGETNLKAKSCVSKCQWIKTPQDLDDFSCKVDYEGPNNDIYSFSGVLTILKGFERSNIDSSVVESTNFSPISIDQLLLRGTKLRNTDWIIGIVTYSGVDTKIEKNSSKASQKRSSVERSVNNKLLILFLLQTIICIVCSIGHNRWHLEDDSEAKPWYIHYDPNQGQDFIYVSYVILYNTLIPLSMYVSMEIIRVSNAHFIDSDLELYDEASDTPAACRNTNINEELGQIQYLFSDKTGTLTCNEMVFNRCSIGGEVYGPEDPSLDRLRTLVKNDLNSSTGIEQPVAQSPMKHSTALLSSQAIPLLASRGEYIKEFLVCLAICNTVLVEQHQDSGDLMNAPHHNNIPKYQAASPDEESLTLTAAKYGFILKSREDKIITVSIHGKDEHYEILNVLEFNSYRKRMSVIVRTPQNQIKLYCKGADSVIFDRAKKNTDHCVGVLQATEKHLSEFACNGLRTLCMSVKTLEPEEYLEWNKVYQEASISLTKKSEKVDQACEIIERDLLLIGSTGIEDRLQDHVPETITALREAGIKVWVLTGDKQETAISISTASAVINEDMELIILNESSKQSLMKRLLEISDQKGFSNDMTGKWGSYIVVSKVMESVAKKLKLEPSDAPNLLNKSTGDQVTKHVAIIIDGSTLALALEPDLRYFFLQVAKTCESVVCCRCSPSQKAKVVNLVAERSILFGDGAITLSIGDGANDVPMIQKAHVGVGISGREGMQAVLASDFAIANFSMLKRLILVHGNRNYKRITKLILYSFSKNIALSISQFWFGFFSGFSGQMIYFDFLFTLYNALFTSLPVIFLGTFDQDIKEEELLNNPSLYRVCQSNTPFSTLKFIWWVFMGMWQSATIFFVTFFVMNTSTIEGGKTLGLWSIGTSAYIYLVVTENLQISFITRYWTGRTIFAVSASVIATFLFVMLYSAIGQHVEPDATHVIFELFKLPTFWFLLVMAPSIALLPFVIVSLNNWLFSSSNISIQQDNLTKKGFNIMMNEI
ncbi:hypothetical protein DICPUDRAFT_95677 [Dictyostelium purpureum]|uniref:Phospholipid-transporting ATPase n=1 Tax=Dictyostelium purpureum TaxID=5786 RepID=F0ZZ85_DICPU|nr:uncharacterized protein DICPUDRAFT_95677 [Dictyostelium purpureum]EGC30740.1 hypothetical protein DICPUDRAFT_95677 [Dictyostelium purpureum]|eukprot:XP_003292724.1 hypothetical protein DICPUDRAFT_95677 [Dictyostelium purpureum]